MNNYQRPKVKFINPDTKSPLLYNKGKFIDKKGKCAKMINGVIDLRPSIINQQKKINEDKIHDRDNILTPPQIFYELVYKKSGHIKKFLNFWFPKIKSRLKPDSVFLEAGGGFCYISAIIKDKCRDTTVCASDISPQYLYKKSIPLAKHLFNVFPDYYLALDAENLPFEDNSIDVIWTHSSLHHFSNVEKFLKEAQRVLKKEGVLIALDTAEPYINRFSYKKKKQKRAKELGIFENSYTIFDWMKISKSTSFFLNYAPGIKIKNKILRFILNSFYPMRIIFTNIKWR
jgi:ubiquinone/menaquinone biosynthesis C-methylase UbiE